MSASSAPTKIGVVTATIVGMNAMIGAGVFTAPAALASYIGPAGILVYIGVIVSVWCMALSCARLAELFPAEGAFYVYTKQWGGHVMGLVASGLYLSGLIVAMGLLTQTAGTYLTHLFPSLTPTLWGCIVLGLLIVLNMCGVVLSALGQQILIACTLFPLLATTVLCFLHARAEYLCPFAPYGFSNVFKATRAVLFGFFGFECAASLFPIVENPQRNVPRALSYSIIIVGIIYILFVTSLIVSTPLSLFTTPRTPLSETLANHFIGHTGLIMLIHLSILSAIIGTVHSMIWSASALALSLGHIASKKILDYSKRFPITVQRSSVLGIGICISIPFFCIHNLDLFFSLTAVGIISSFMLSLITLLTIKQEWHNGRNSITIAGLGTAGVMLYFAIQGLWQAL
jgi:amino acid transporter